MNKDLTNYLDEKKIDIVNPIIGTDGECDGYHLRSSSMANHHNDFMGLKKYLNEFKHSYYAVDGYNYKDGKHCIFLHNI